MYKVPEKYRNNEFNPHLSSREGDLYGMFVVLRDASPNSRGMKINIICLATEGSDEIPWEHVSVSVKSYGFNELNRCPSWEEMCFIKDLFWDKEDTVIQFHPPESEYVSQHHYVLHLWRKMGENAETPPSEAVGFTKGQNLKS